MLPLFCVLFCFHTAHFNVSLQWSNMQQGSHSMPRRVDAVLQIRIRKRLGAPKCSKHQKQIELLWIEEQWSEQYRVHGAEQFCFSSFARFCKNTEWVFNNGGLRPNMLGTSRNGYQFCPGGLLEWGRSAAVYSGPQHRSCSSTPGEKSCSVVSELLSNYSEYYYAGIEIFCALSSPSCPTKFMYCGGFRNTTVSCVATCQ